MQNDPKRLKKLLEAGLCPQQKSVDGATPLHRCAEIGSIKCAEILLSFGVNIDCGNLMGQTPFHVAGINRNLEFGQFMILNKARQSCSEGCTKCRWLCTMIRKKRIDLRKFESMREQQKVVEPPQTPKEPSKKKKVKKQPDSPTDSIVSLTTELERCRLEMQGPYLDPEENLKLRQKQRQARQESEWED